MKQPITKNLLALLMSLFVIPVTAHDIEVENAEGVTIYYNWINNNTELAVTYRGSTYNYYNEYLDTVVIPEAVIYNGNTYRVTSISEEAFGGCNQLTSVTIPNSVKSIGRAAFRECIGLTSIIIPNSVTSINGGAFHGCSGLTSITIPNSVTTIENNLFYGCTGLTSVTIGDNVTTISDYVFVGCMNLTSFSIPASVNYVGVKCFYDCGIVDLYCYAENPPSLYFDEYCFDDGLLKYGTLHVPEGTIEKYKSALLWKDFINIVEMPGSSDSKRIIHVDRAGTLSNYILEEEEFQIKELTLTGEINGDDLRLLREMAGCPYFGGNSGGKGKLIYLDISGVTIVAGGGYYYEEEGLEDNHLYKINKDYEIPAMAFLHSHLRTIILPENIKSIGDNAFLGCVNLSSITSKLIEPFAINDYIFYSENNVIYENAMLIVPEGTKSAYQSIMGWRNFKNIVEDSTNGIESIVSAPIGIDIWYNLQGQRVDNPGKGIYIKNRRKIVKK